MYIPLILSMFAMLPRTGRCPAFLTARAEATKTQQRALHFRYILQKSGTLLEPAGRHKFVRIRFSLPSTKVTEDYTRSTALHPNGKFVYSCAGEMVDVEQYRVGQSGRLYPLMPFKVAAHSHPGDISLHPNGRFAYVSCSHGAICQYRIRRSGQFVPLVPAEVYGSNDPSPLRFDSSGHFACIVADGPDDIGKIVSVYRIQADGTLKLVRAIHSPCMDVGINRITVQGRKISEE